MGDESKFSCQEYYKKQLSSFGCAVLKQLIKKWNDNNHSNKFMLGDYCRPGELAQHKHQLRFSDSSIVRNVTSPSQENRRPLSPQLSSQRSGFGDDDASSDLSRSNGPGPNIPRDSSRHDGNGSGWSDMIDHQLFDDTECSLTASPVAPPAIDTTSDDRNVAVNNGNTETDLTKKPSKHKLIQPKIDATINRIKNSNQTNGDSPKRICRKEKLTKSVMNWLEDVEGGGAARHGGNVIQTRLANKGGIMKFGKPTRDYDAPLLENP